MTVPTSKTYHSAGFGLREKIKVARKDILFLYRRIVERLHTNLLLRYHQHKRSVRESPLNEP